jgi:hypothetical protein
MDSKQELLEVERARWREFRDLVDRIPSDRMEDPTLNADGWSVKDLLWHIRCSNAVLADELEKIEAGTFEDFDWKTEENNERFLAEGRRMDPVSVQAELVVSREPGRARDGRADGRPAASGRALLGDGVQAHRRPPPRPASLRRAGRWRLNDP